MNVPIKRSELLDDFWRSGHLLDTTYLRALVFDGLTPAEANERLAKLKAQKCSTAAHVTADPSTASPSTTVYRR